MNCLRCQAETASTYLCHRDTTLLRETIEQIPDALETVADTVARQDRVGSGAGRAGGDSRPPVNLAALEHATHLTELVHSWARMVLEVDGDADRLQGVAPDTYLRMSVPLIAAQDFAGDMLDELHDAVRDVWRVADRPPERFAFGTCDHQTEVGTCRHKILCPPETTWHQCAQCGAWHNIPARIQSMHENVKGEPLPPRECREFLHRNAQMRIKAKDFENWVALRRLPYVLEHVGYGGERRLYRPGVVFGVAERMQQRRRAA